MEGNCSRLDGDAAGSLGGQEVGHGGAVVDVPDAARVAAIVEHALCGGRLACINVGDDADISGFGRVVRGAIAGSGIMLHTAIAERARR